MLVRSEEKGRSVLEILVFVGVILSVIFSIWQFAETPLKISPAETNTCVAHHASKTQLRAES